MYRRFMALHHDPEVALFDCWDLFASPPARLASGLCGNVTGAAIATADVECAGDMYAEIDDIRKEYESEFIEKYRDLLERQRDLMQDI